MLAHASAGALRHSRACSWGALQYQQPRQQARWFCTKKEGTESAEGTAAPSIEQKISQTDPKLYHLENGEKLLGGSGIGAANADMALLFECRVCKTQAVKQFSRHSYEKGVVLIQCPGCKNKHVIADNLGWFYDMGENNNIEKQMSAEGQELKRVSVSEAEYAQFLKGSVNKDSGEVAQPGTPEAKSA
eukprot:TRINITY_DN32812_c0_g1_i2.p1 TRINITY_DN32812_c0_g1~~TRINITY_DN32812_c0_g1_i2.p1  ORF type:complete len:211 (+),score=64.41 TRINITY_DN32812_c0_g1_i2:71-634(+)